MYKINAYITLSIPDNYYKGKPDEIASYIHKETGLNYEVLNLSKRGCNNDKSIFDLKLLFIIAKKKAPKLVGDLQTKFIELYSHKNKNIEISLNEVYVKLVEE